TKVYAGPFTIPDSAGPIDLTLTSPFQYTGKTMYVAFEFQSTGPFTTQNAVFASNITRTSTVWTGFSSTALPNILNDVSDFRPVLRFGFPIPAVQWSAVAAGVQPNFIALDIADDLSAWAASPSGAVSLTNDGGKTWSHAPAVPDSVRFILGLSANSGLAISGAAAGPSRVYTAASSDSVWGKVTDPSLAIRIDAAGKTSSQSVWCLGAGAGDTLVLLNSNSGGKSWTRSVTGIVFEAGTKIASTSACRIGNAVWFGTEGTGGSSGRVYRSSTGPAGPWRYSATGRANVQAIAFSASGGTGIVSHAGCIDTIRRCVDGGVNWSPLVVPGLGEVRSLQYYSGGIDVWAATSTGIWRSSDDGLSWLRTFASTSGAQSLSVVRFFANYQSGLAVGSGGQILRGAWVINPASDVSDAPAQPSGFWLGANYPNPFNSSTWIEYSVPWLSRVSLKVIDLLGREVATLVAAEEGPGTFKVQWNGNRNASGVYFCRMAVRPLPGTASREYVRTERLILLK
ncbi:MAG TPA: hypothetical protein VMH23_19520, partial [Bacteroidota bacterium]|nr:hypothetical protein [Bacteroidota bacterium]